MGLFPERATIKDINRTLIRAFSEPGIRIIGDLEVSDEDFAQLKAGLRPVLTANFREQAGQFSESLCLFLVYCAQHASGSESFWGQVREHLMPISSERQRQIRQLFGSTCRLYGLPDFEDESRCGQAIITPISCHAGIGANDQPAFFRLLTEAVDTVQTLGEVDLGAAIFDDILVHQAPVHISYFLKALGDDRDTYLSQWHDVTRYFYEKSSTAQSLARDIASVYGTGEIYRIPQRLLAAYCTWRQRPKPRESLRPLKKIATRTPRIRLDAEGMGIYVRLPQQSFSSQIRIEQATWLVWAGDSVIAIDCDSCAEIKGTMASTVETSACLKPAGQYRFELYLEAGQAEPVASWYHDFRSRKYLTFTPEGDLIDSETIRKTNALLVFDEHGDLNVNTDLAELAELGPIPDWPRHRVVRVSSPVKTTLSLIDRMTQGFLAEIQMAPFTQPELVGGQLLLDNPGMYTHLPSIRLPRNLDSINPWTATLFGPSGRSDFELDWTEGDEWPLEQVIDQDTFGPYDLRLRHPAGHCTQIRFFLAPELNRVTDTRDWPLAGMGYPTPFFKFLLPAAVNLDFLNVPREVEFNEGNQHVLIFANRQHYSRVHGWIKLNQRGHEIKIPLSVTPRPILWSFIGHNRQDQVILTDKPIRQAFKDLVLQPDQSILLQTGNLGSGQIPGRFSIRQPDGMLLTQRDCLLRAWSSLRLTISDLLLHPEIGLNRRLQINLELALPDPAGRLSWPILIVTDELAIENLKQELTDEGLFLQWDEPGDQTDRVVLLADLLEPWADPIVWPLPDRQTDVLIRSSDIKKGLYRYDIRPTPERSPFGPSDDQPPHYYSDRLVKLGLRNYQSSAMRSFNAKAQIFLTNPALDKLEIPAINLSTADEIVQLAKTTLYFIANKTAFDQPAKFDQVIQQLKRISQQLAFSPGEILFQLLHLSLTPAQFKTLQHFFGVLILPNDGFSPTWRASDSSRLTALNECTAFQAGLSRRENLTWMVRWIGENDLRQLLGQEQGIDLQELLETCLAGENTADRLGHSVKWTVQASFWGISTESGQASLNHDQLLNRSFPDALRTLEKVLARNPGQAQLFNASFLRNIQPRLSPFEKNYPVLLNKLKKRSGNIQDSLLKDMAERIGETAMAAALYRRGLWPALDPRLMAQIARVQSLCPEFYRRDLVLIEFYLLGGGK